MKKSDTEREKNARDFLCLIGPMMKPRGRFESLLPIIISVLMVIATIITMTVAIARF
jgi:hypothetical protein